MVLDKLRVAGADFSTVAAISGERFSNILSNTLNWYPYSIEEETDKRDGKGRRCCLGDRIHSILNQIPSEVLKNSETKH